MVGYSITLFSDDFGSYFVAVVKKTDQSRNFTRASLSASHACVSDIELTTGYLFNNSRSLCLSRSTVLMTELN